MPLSNMGQSARALSGSSGAGDRGRLLGGPLGPVLHELSSAVAARLHRYVRGQRGAPGASRTIRERLARNRAKVRCQLGAVRGPDRERKAPSAVALAEFGIDGRRFEI